jgi:hypothetical protein
VISSCFFLSLLGEDILLAMLTLGFDAYVEPLRTFLTKVRDASKYDRTITMGGDLTDDLRIQVAQAQSNQTAGAMAQAQVATTVQVQSQPTLSSSSMPVQSITPKPSGATANSNGLEPYGHSVSVIFLLVFDPVNVRLSLRFVWSRVFEMINRARILTTSTRSNPTNRHSTRII